MSELDPSLLYDFNKLASVCKELDFNYELLNADEFKVTWCDDIYLVFANLIEEYKNREIYKDFIDIDNIPTTMVYNDYTHTHGLYIDIDYDPATYFPRLVHYLDIPLLIRTGELLIFEIYRQKALEYQWLVFNKDIAERCEDLESGNEVRIIRP